MNKTSLSIVFLCLTGLAGIVPMAFSQTASGKVFADLNANQLADKGERGIPGVAVSNGVDVVLTDKEGNYSISCPEKSVLFVIKPADYSFHLNSEFLPQFAYRHYPNGSGRSRYPGVAPTGPLPEQINFGLIPRKEPTQFRALFMGDTQPYSIEDVDFLSFDVLSGLTGQTGFAFASILGDIVGDDLSLYAPLNQAMAVLQVPFFHVQGNHDMNYDATEDSRASETYQAVYGPRNYAFNIGQVHFVVLDDIMYSGDTVRRNYTEGFDATAIAFVQNDLKSVPSDRLVVLMMHAPIINEYTRTAIPGTEKIMAALSAFPHTFSISGHNHTVSQHLISNSFGWPHEKPHHHFNAGAACGDWWQGALDAVQLPDATMRDGSPNGYVIASFDGNQYKMDYQVARREPDYQMNIYAPRVVKRNSGWGGVSHAPVYVNFFTGSSRDTVKIAIDNQPAKTMVRTVEPDPAYIAVTAMWDQSSQLLPGRRPSNPEPCLHLWKSSIPTDLSPGLHKMKIEAKDLFGRVHTAYHFFRIAE